jgi:hypothetical protein
MPKITIIIKAKNITNNFIDTEAIIPIVKRLKKITSSKGFLTGFLNLTIDTAPIIPNDKARSPLMIVVIKYPVTGKKI